MRVPSRPSAPVRAGSGRSSDVRLSTVIDSLVISVCVTAVCVILRAGKRSVELRVRVRAKRMPKWTHWFNSYHAESHEHVDEGPGFCLTMA